MPTLGWHILHRMSHNLYDALYQNQPAQPENLLMEPTLKWAFKLKVFLLSFLSKEFDRSKDYFHQI